MAVQEICVYHHAINNRRCALSFAVNSLYMGLHDYLVYQNRYP